MIYNYNKLTPFKKYIIQNFPFIDADFDALTNYQLYCKIVEYLNKVIDSENGQNEQIELLTNAFNNLHDYVENYFANLDVQEEINNKLDNMVEEGTIQEIIAVYLNSKAVFGYDNVESMKSSTNLIAGSYARTMGFYNANDGGSALYRIREITNSDVVNNMNIIPMNNENLIAELINDSLTINIKKLGAKNCSPNTNDNDISNILEFAYENYSDIVIPSGEYYLSILNPNTYGKQNKTIRGLTHPTIYTTYGFDFDGLNSGIYDERISLLYIKDLNIYGAGRSNSNRMGTGISLKWFGECYVSNCYFRFLDKGIELINGSEFVLQNSQILGCNHGIFSENNRENQYTDIDAVSVENCAISNSNYIATLDSVRGFTFDKCALINSHDTSLGGLLIKNSYADSVNINILNCEFENDSNSHASIIVGQNNETYKLSELNIINSKFIMYSDNSIDIYNGSIVNINNSFFTYTYPRIVTIESGANQDLKINLKGNYYSFETRIVDYRSTYYGNFYQNDFNQINYFPNMDHSISEFAVSVAPTFSNGKVSFSNNGFINFRLNPNNYNPIEGVGLIVIGKNISSCACVKNGSVQTSNFISHPNLSDSRKCYFNIFRGENISEVRINVQNGTELEKIVILGTNRNELPDFRTANISDVNYIGTPSKGDTFKATSSSLSGKSLITWNGSSYTQI